jgi:hypothetical protein
MNEAEKILTPIEIAGKQPGYMSAATGAIPMVGSVAQNLVSGADVQKYRQAQADWVRAKLRKESY